MNQAELRKQSGDPAGARNLLFQAREIAAQGQAWNALTWVELRLAALLEDFAQADAMLRHALTLAQSRHDAFLTAGAFGNLGYIRLRQFRYDEAIPYFENAGHAAEKIPSKIILEKNLLNLGWCYFRLGEADRALSLYSKAAQLAGEQGLVDDQQKSLGNIGSIYHERGMYDKANSYYEQARAIAQKLDNREDAATWLNNMTTAQIDNHNWEAAEKLHQKALETLRGAAGAGWVEAYSRLNAGFIDTAQGRTNDALSSFAAAIRLARNPYQPNVIWQAHSGLAELYRSRNQPDAAAREYAAAMNVLDREWLALSRDQSKITFRSYEASVYQDYVAFLSERHEIEKALEVAESSRARLLAQKLDGRSTSLPHFRAADAVQLSRATATVLLDYWLAPSRSYLWAITPHGVEQFRLPGERELGALIDRHQRAIQNLEDLLASANQELYRTLIAPAEPLLRSASQVIIVPDGRLYDLNFETLVNGEAKPHYWIEDKIIAVAPSLSVLHARTAEPQNHARLLIIGDPLPADPQFPPLAHLKAEISGIAAEFPTADRAIYTGAEAYPEHFREAGPNKFTAIHFAAHAAANEQSPLNSAIVLSPHAGNYKLYVSEVADLAIQPEVVTISACRSAGARAYSGEGLVGFAWAFLQAGAQNVVAGIWNVDDAAAPVVMEEFYREWRSGTTAAAALRGAKLKLVHSAQAFRKPYYWGPFEVFTRHATRSAMDLAWRNNSR
ncbi:MAG TPA: CHAT domain-containing protein [Bryobacteraceae bacterium]|nr:CHAT domain-containing protein [Bryobacteraceae bacterium]